MVLRDVLGAKIGARRGVVVRPSSECGVQVGKIGAIGYDVLRGRVCITVQRLTVVQSRDLLWANKGS